MNSKLLEGMGFQPKTVGAARLVDYALEIGERATLISEPGRITYGYLLDLENDETSRLYSRPEVDGYEAETVETILMVDGSTHKALCYLLPESKIGVERNTAYAAKLTALVRELGLPTEYANEIARFENDT